MATAQRNFSFSATIPPTGESVSCAEIHTHVVQKECWSTKKIFSAGVVAGTAYWSASLVSGENADENDIFDDEALAEYFSEKAKILNEDSQDWLAVSTESIRLIFE